ncbi:uncharacterized protein LOC144351928 [Saccoglossus kowalevskii]
MVRGQLIEIMRLLKIYRIIVLFFFSCPSFIVSQDDLLYKEVNMFDGNCWNNVVSEAGKLVTHDNRQMVSSTLSLICKTTIKTRKVGSRINLSFFAFSLVESPGCETEALHIYDGESINSPILTQDSGGLCGDIDPGVYSSSGSALTVHYTAKAEVAPPTYAPEVTDDVTRGFIAWWTSYVPVTAINNDTDSNEGGSLIEMHGETLFCCIDGIMCINSVYRCDGINNCLDESDETILYCKLGKSWLGDLAVLTGVPLEIWVGIIIIVLFIMLIIAIVLIVCCCCGGRRKKGAGSRVKGKSRHHKNAKRSRHSGRRIRRRTLASRNAARAPPRSGASMATDTSDSVFQLNGGNKSSILAAAAIATQRDSFVSPLNLGGINSTYFSGFPGKMDADGKHFFSTEASSQTKTDPNPSPILGGFPARWSDVDVPSGNFHIPRAIHQHTFGDDCSVCPPDKHTTYQNSELSL